MAEEVFSTQRLDHLGIVSGICQKIDLIEQIDNFIGQTERKVSVGEAVQSMVLNALGFVGRPLYLCNTSRFSKIAHLFIFTNITDCFLTTLSPRQRF